MEVEPFLHPPRPPSEVRTELGLAPDDVVVGKVARLFELKGHDDVLDVAPELCRAAPKLRFLFIGGGVWRSRLEQRVRDAGLEGRVIFAGLVPSMRIPELLHACDLIVHASYREGLARVLPQALISGKPVVSYDVDGAREVVLPNETGMLVPAGDRAKLGDAIRTLALQPEWRLRLGLAGRAKFTERYRHENMTAAIRREYENVLSQK
jgi:glycosyltransferase involved in cell wall biosynthesis